MLCTKKLTEISLENKAKISRDKDCIDTILGYVVIRDQIWRESIDL